MSYIGATPVIGNFQKCDAITTSATDTFNILVGGVAVSPATPQNCIVSLNGVIQAPVTAYTLSGSTIVFASALTTSDVIDFIVILGNVLDIGTPSDDTVTAAKLNDTAISGQTALGAEPADTDEFLVSDAGALKRVDYSYIKPGSADYVKIKSQTASTTTAIDFINGTSDVVLDSTYKIYKFFFYNMKPATDDTQFQIRTSTDLGVTWDELIGGNSYPAFEPPGSNTFTNTSWSNGSIVGAVGNAAAEDCNGEVTLFNPSGSVEFTKLSAYTISGRADGRTSVYINVFRAQAAEDVDAVRFEMGSGDMASGTIVLYGIK